MEAKTQNEDQDNFVSNKRELEDLLRLAENLQEKIDQIASKVSLFRMVVAGYAVTIVVVGYYFYQKSGLTLVLPIAALIPFLFVASEQLSRKSTKRLQREIRALNEVVSLLRETESAVSKRQNWSAVQRAEFRIRLSRFQIKEKA